MSHSPSSPSPRDGLRHTLDVNDGVYVERESHHQQLEGVVAFLGNVSFADGDWVGVRLTGSSVGLGLNDGSVQGVRYFSCGPQNGIFVRHHHIRHRPLTKLEELRLRRGNASAPTTPRSKPYGNGSPRLSRSPASPQSSRNREIDSNSPRVTPSIQPSSDEYDDFLDDILEPGETDTSQRKSRANKEYHPPAAKIEKSHIPKPGKNNIHHDAHISVRDTPRQNEPLLTPYDDSLTTPLLEPPPSVRRRAVPPAGESNLPSSPSLSHKRILDRDAAFHQSRGRWSVQRMSQGSAMRRLLASRRMCWRLCDDWFHRLAYKPTVVIMVILFLMYTGAVFFFAFVYRVVNIIGTKYTISDDGKTIPNPFCGMDLTNHMEALYFSLSTMTTIGYGVSDYYFGDCWTPLILVLWQVCTAITFDAVAIGLLFLRISRGRKRGKTIIFSDKAVIRRVRGCPHLMFRIGELRRNYIIEAAIRVYCVRHERYPIRQDDDGPPRLETTHFVTRHVSLIHPDESTGSHILMSLPQVVVHKMDESSPLIPPVATWYDEAGNERHFHQTPERNRPSLSKSYAEQRSSIQDFHMDRGLEIVVLVEGTDEVTGSALQARHSYCWDDILWDHTFAPCVFPVTDDEYRQEESRAFRERGCRRPIKLPACCIDFDRFHEVLQVPDDCNECPYVPRPPTK